VTAPAQPINLIASGINRLRVKGNAAQQSLYDLLNGYVTAQGTVQVRPGTFRNIVLPASTKGLVAFQGTFHTFNNVPVDLPAGYTLHILTHPAAADNGDTPVPLKQIHFAAPFMGFLYVVAEFEPVNTAVIDAGVIFHYWIQGYGTGSNSSTWKASNMYFIQDIVTPTVPNGLAYTCSRRTSPNPLWTPSTPETEGAKVEPNTANGFYFVAEVEGTSPSTGTVEPVWPTTIGASVQEVTQITDGQSVSSSAQAAPAAPAVNAPSSSTTKTYSNIYGGTTVTSTVPNTPNQYGIPPSLLGG
jgi:hypothetical protein